MAMMPSLLLGASLSLLGIVTGIHVSVLLHDHRIGELRPNHYVAMHQMRDRTFRRVMPGLWMATWILVMVCTILLFAPGTARTLGGISALTLLVDMALTVTRQMPLNDQIQGWTITTIPADWARVRDRWATHHHLRSALAIVAYACFISAALVWLGRE